MEFKISLKLALISTSLNENKLQKTWKKVLTSKTWFDIIIKLSQRVTTQYEILKSFSKGFDRNRKEKQNKFQKSVDKRNLMWYNSKATWKRKAREKRTGLWKLNNANKKTRNCFEWCDDSKEWLPPKVYRSEDNTTNVKR